FLSPTDKLWRRPRRRITTALVLPSARAPFTAITATRGATAPGTWRRRSPYRLTGVMLIPGRQVLAPPAGTSARRRASVRLPRTAGWLAASVTLLLLMVFHLTASRC